MILFSGLCWVMFHTAILSDSRSLLVTGFSYFMFVDFLSNLNTCVIKRTQTSTKCNWLWMPYFFSLKKKLVVPPLLRIRLVTSTDPNVNTIYIYFHSVIFFMSYYDACWFCFIPLLTQKSIHIVSKNTQDWSLCDLEDNSNVNGNDLIIFKTCDIGFKTLDGTERLKRLLHFRQKPI